LYLNPDQAFQKAVTKYNRYSQYGLGSAPRTRGSLRYNQGHQNQGSHLAGSRQQHYGPPSRLGVRQSSIREMLAYANCVAGDCIRCGRAGHAMSSDTCPLQGKPLQERPCMKCNQGLHSTDDCDTTYRPFPAGQAADWSDDSEDLSE